MDDIEMCPDIPDKSAEFTGCRIPSEADHNETVEFRTDVRNTSAVMIPLKVCVYQNGTQIKCTGQYGTSPDPGPGRLWNISLTMPGEGDEVAFEFRLMSNDEVLDTLLKTVTLPGAYVPPVPDPMPPTVCNEGELRGATICGDGSTIYAEVCQNNKWVATGDRCPDDPIPPVPDPDPDGTDWTTIALIGAAAVLFYLLATRS